MPDGRPSLRRRLLVLLLAGTSLVWVAIAIATYFDARIHTGRIFDAQLVEYSAVLAALTGHEAHEITDESSTFEHDFGQAATYQVFSLTGSLLLRSNSAPEAPLSAQDGFSDVTVAGTRWRAFRRVDAENQFVIIVAHLVDEREALVLDFALRLLLPVVFGLPLIAIAMWMAVTRAVAPLEQLAEEVRGREMDRLTPLVAHDAPQEVAPLVASLNQLFERLERSFEKERRFTGDAAHELRTPLAALKTHAEVALTTASDERRRRSLEQVVRGVDRASRLVEQMLTLARLDASHAGHGTRADLAEVAREALEPMRGLAQARGVDVRFDIQAAGSTVLGEASILHALVRNLLENAIRHVPEGGVVRLSIKPRAGRVLLDVEDSGPGVAPELRSRIFDRHFRVPGASGGAGGLGLSIARRVVELHGGRIEAGESSDLGGLRVSAWLPQTDKDSLSRQADSGAVTHRKETAP